MDDDDRQKLLGQLRRSEWYALGRCFFWLVNLPVVVAIYLLNRPLWEEASILYLAIVSIYAIVESPYTTYKAARAERRSLEHPSD